MQISLIGYLSDARPGDTLFYVRGAEDPVIEVTVDALELMLDADGYSPFWIDCHWTDEAGEPQSGCIFTHVLFKSKEDAIKYLRDEEKKEIERYQESIVKARSNILRLEEQLAQLHV